VTPAALMADLEARGVRLAAMGERLRVDAPRGALTATDRDALVRYKPALLAALRAEAWGTVTAADDSWSDGVRDGPCGLCGHQPLAEVHDWPTAGERRWVCLRCVARPASTLAVVNAGLTDFERRQLRTDAYGGDPLARLLLGSPAEGMA